MRAGYLLRNHSQQLLKMLEKKDEISEDQLTNIVGSNYQCEFCGKRFIRREDLEDHKTAMEFREYQEEMFLDTERM